MQLDNIAAYWNKRAEGYSASIHKELLGEDAHRFQSLLRSAMPAGNNLNCLDMGCGPGFFTLLLNSDGHTVTSADYSPEMLERTRMNCIEACYEPHIVRADAQNLPFADESFDFICSRNLVWNLEDPLKAYSEWFRVLKPGGRMFIFDGNYYLHYYNEDYRKARENASVNKAISSHSTYGVDPTPIDEIAKSLPLSREMRPDWDAKVLPKIGFNVIDITVFSETGTEPDTNSAPIYNFVITAAKP